MALVLDTGPLFAALDADDANHQECRRLIENTAERLVIPGPVLVELDFLCLRAGRPDHFVAVLDDVSAGAFDVVEPSSGDRQRVASLLREYPDLGLGYVDAAVFAIVERLGEVKLATLDHRHFATLRPRHVEALQLLPA